MEAKVEIGVADDGHGAEWQVCGRLWSSSLGVARWVVY